MGITNAELRSRYPTGRALAEQVRARTDTVILSFSAGKDSLAAWLLLRELGFAVVPVYKWLVPGLGFVERSLAYYEGFFGVRIHRYPHPSFYRWLARLTFQAPQNVSTVLAARLVEYTHEQLMAQVRKDRGLPEGTLVAVGTRACDSPVRRMAFAKGGPSNEARLSFCPVWDRSKADVVGAVRAAGVKLACEYRVFGRSFDGIDFRFLHGIRQHWPDDYAKILEFFPLAELELLRHDFATKGHDHA